MLTKYSLPILALCFLASRVPPSICQDDSFIIDDNDNNNAPENSNTNTNSVTSSPEFIRCLAECPSTSEYNPICASDMVSYNNPGKLRCAQRCGANIQALRGGTCRGL
ncbi:unnamed protein product [Acanthoscelides obtectus]|uniref:Kazal-like domain-containing protein n=1 Tax=Acanthoscelides obtectus TaxID=200917 RepID=A0A9P0PZ98_ACAOB|nr:unnamed protein product [Acanthoscelides obtectus]CAK1647726.1 hypothetical protein AOBTE_LOCUS15369 [Acanthoscelides obtectus]